MQDLLKALFAAGDALLNTPLDAVDKLLAGDSLGALASLVTSVASSVHSL